MNKNKKSTDDNLNTAAETLDEGDFLWNMSINAITNEIFILFYKIIKITGKTITIQQYDTEKISNNEAVPSNKKLGKELSENIDKNGNLYTNREILSLWSGNPINIKKEFTNRIKSPNQFNGDLKSWDVSKIPNYSSLFNSVPSFKWPD